MGENKKKRQHYVPQCYLHNFTNDAGFIHVFDKDTEKTFTNNILDVAREIYFYDFPEFNEEKFRIFNPSYTESEIELVKQVYKDYGEGQAIENGFSKIETEFSNLLNDTIDRCLAEDGYKTYKRKELFNNKEKRRMANFIALQFLRTKEFRIQIQWLYRKMMEVKIDKYYQQYLDDFKKGTFNKDLDSFVPIIQAGMMGRPEHLKEMIDIFFQRYWAVGINETNKSLYTSDNPIAQHARNKNIRYGIGGFALADLIVFPLSSKVILLMHKKEPKEKFIKLSETDINFYNNLQVKCSNRQVYSKNENFNTAKEVMKKYGDKFKSKRQRL